MPRGAPNLSTSGLNASAQTVSASGPPTLEHIKLYSLYPLGLFFFFNFYLFMIVTQRVRERGRDTGRGRSRLHAPGARCGIRSWVSRIAPCAKGRHQTAAPPRDPRLFFSSHFVEPLLPYFKCLNMGVSVCLHPVFWEHSWCSNGCNGHPLNHSSR